jgi:uncharacterized protein DUF6544
MKVISIIAVAVLAILFIGWLGLQVKPRPFSMPRLPQSPTKTVPIPSGLPAPVERFYRAMYGDQVPVVDTVVITGRGRMRPFGIWLPARFVITHNAGRDYRHYFEATFFGIPFLKVNEGYVDGKSFFESPMGNAYDDPNTNQGANLALWAEGAWFPSLWVTDSRARWEAVDDNTALLRVPFEDQTETFIVRFNPRTAMVDNMEAMRFRAANDTAKILWITSSSPDGAVGYATWFDNGKPWLGLSVEELVQNMDVRDYIRARGE